LRRQLKLSPVVQKLIHVIPGLKGDEGSVSLVAGVSTANLILSDSLSVAKAKLRGKNN